MTAAEAHFQKIQMIWTREIDGQPMAGRLRVAHAIRKALQESATLQELVMHTALEDKARDLLPALYSFVKSLLAFKPLPLQCALYSSHREIDRIVKSIDPEVDIIYLDGVRTYALLKALRAAFPEKRIVVDLDDLMSRRMEILHKMDEPLSPGYLMQKLPRFIAKVVLGSIGKMVPLYEAKTLPRVEGEMARMADSLVLLSRVDMAELPQTGRAERHVILPWVPSRPSSLWPKPGPLRFAFIGTDVLTQNKLSIDYLINLWKRFDLETPLIIVGNQLRQLESPPAIEWLGYVQSIDDVYDGRTILLTPSFMPGGIKTKVLEGFAYGAPVIGNSLTFEAMPIKDYPLKIDDEEELVALLRSPEQQRERLETAATYGKVYLEGHHSKEVFKKKWADAMGISEKTPCSEGTFV